MIPQKSRLFCAILDLSFKLKVNGVTLPSVNLATNVLAPQKSMEHLSQVLKRLVFDMGSSYDPNQSFLFSKVDMKDGFWRPVLSRLDAWNFCYVLPAQQGTKTLNETEIVVSHALQMGWSKFPPFFCTATETAQDIIQTLATSPTKLPLHPLESYIIPNSAKHSNTPPHSITQMEVYVDDFIAMTNNASSQHLTNWSRSILHGIHSIFPPPLVTQHKGGDPISIKKLKQEDRR